MIHQTFETKHILHSVSSQRSAWKVLKIVAESLWKLKMLLHDRIQMFFYKWARAFLAAVGHDIFLEHFRPNILTYFLYAVFALYYICNFHTMATRKFMRALGALAYLLMGNQVRFILYDFLRVFFVSIYQWYFPASHKNLFGSIQRRLASYYSQNRRHLQTKFWRECSQSISDVSSVCFLHRIHFQNWSCFVFVFDLDDILVSNIHVHHGT